MADQALRRWQIFSLLDGPGAQVLTFVLQRGTNYSPIAPVQFDQYLMSLTGASTANYLKLKSEEKKQTFNSEELKQIQEYPLWDSFDLTLLHKAIRLGCENIAELNDYVKWGNPHEMEGLIKKIKDQRNSSLHEKQHLTESAFHAKVKELEGIFDECLKKAKIRYNVPDADFTPVRDKVLKDISSIKVLTAKQVLDQILITSQLLFKKEIKTYLEDCYQRARYFNPTSYLSGSQQTIDIQVIFCKPLLINRTDEREENIDSLNILSLTKSVVQGPQPSTASQGTQSTPGNKPHFFIICGQAGSGKTTLLNYLLSERIKDAQNCGIEHLSDYDIVLKIVCSEDNGPSLQDFLQRALPHIFDGIQDRLVALLKEHKVLFVIDGLDELSPGSSSEQLVRSILEESKNVPHFTVISTSRMESANDFLATVPDSYHQWKLEMKGVSLDQRASFVLNYYDSFSAHSSKDRDGLIKLMQDIGWRDYLESPLNLMFLATLYDKNPNLVKNNDTQTSLHVIIHEWCLEKLQGRLAVHPHSQRFPVECKNNIRKILKSIYQVALRGIMNNRLNLSEEDTHLLKDCCNAKNLPPKEVMGAYLCLREDVVENIIHQRYSVPNKSLQEFWGAKAIIENLQEGLTNGTIRHMLQEPSKPQLKQIKNLLLHLAGLLSQPDISPMPRAIEEVVDMLQECGMECCEDWLSLLHDAEVNSDVLQRVAHHIRRKPRGGKELVINDTTVTSAAALLPLIPLIAVRIGLQRRETTITELGQALTDHICMGLYLWHHYKHPTSQPPASDTRLDALPRNDLVEFMGHLSADGILLLQEFPRMWSLRVGVGSDHDALTIVPTLADVCPLLPHLTYFGVHVLVEAVTAEVLTTRLPDVRGICGNSYVHLVLSGISEHLLEKASRIASALQPKMGKYRTIKFPSCCKMDVAQWKRFIDLLADAQVKVSLDLGIPWNMLEEEKCRELTTLARTRGLGGFRRDDEYNMWGY